MEPVRVALIDEDCRDFSGHHAAWDLPVCRELERRGVAWSLWGDALADTTLGVEPVFNAAAGRGRLGRAARIPATNLRILDTLIRVITPTLRDGDLVILCRPTMRTRLAYAAWLPWLRMRGPAVRVHYVIHNRPDRHFRVEARLLRRGGRDLRFIAHTAAVARRARALGATPVDVWPVPFVPASSPAGSAAAGERERGGGPVTIAYLGLAHPNKGLDTLVDAITRLEGALRTGSIRLVIQFNPTVPHPSLPRLDRRLHDLASQLRGVHVRRGMMTPDEYAEMLSAADVVALPHRNHAYADALPGTFLDAVMLDRPVIVPRLSHMAELVGNTGAAVMFADGDAASLADAILRAARSCDALTDAARRQGPRWREAHGPGPFVDMLLAELPHETPPARAEAVR
jgi:glycosyltransferase involved in cell wall biosynthesis